MDKPDFVANFTKPQNTEIKHIGNGWYLYHRSYVYDPNTKRSRKKPGTIIGHTQQLKKSESGKSWLVNVLSSLSYFREDWLEVPGHEIRVFITESL